MEQMCAKGMPCVEHQLQLLLETAILIGKLSKLLTVLTPVTRPAIIWSLILCKMLQTPAGTEVFWFMCAKKDF
ncbi:TKL family protein kinase [Sesbania bispinosa]|nr:TKL family protein kinase [Sesbania bispinosa]